MTLITILEDTRNKVGEHVRKNEQLRSLGYAILRSKLPAGDYALMTDLSTVIDTKKDIQEIYGNLIGKEHDRFRRECLLCRENNIRLVILCEHMYADTMDELKKMIGMAERSIQAYKNNGYRQAPQKYYKALRDLKHNMEYPVYCLEDVATWQNPRLRESPKAVNGDQLYKTMVTMSEKYGVQWEFCDRLHTGQKIVQLLIGGDADDQG